MINNINLLPSELKEAYESSKKNRSLLNTFIAVLIIMIIFFAALFSSRIYLSGQIKTIDKEVFVKEQSISKYGTLEKDAKKMSDKIAAAKKLIDSKAYFSKILNQVWEATPSKVYVLEVSFEKENGKRGKLTGSAENKIELAKFVEGLEKTEAFEYVDIENSTISNDTYLQVPKENFALSFSIKGGSFK